MFLFVLLSLSCLAYSYDIYGCVVGLEEGKEYTASKYDIISEKWSAETALTDKTQLPSGIWRITEKGGASEELFIGNSKSGMLNYWNADKSKGDYNYIVSTPKDGITPGKWSVGKNGSLVKVVYSAMKSATIPTVCIYNEKARFLSPIDGSIAYAPAKTGEDNLLQEGSVSYGFTAEQVVPASSVNSIDFVGVVIRTSALSYTEGHSLEDLVGEFTFIVKTPDKSGYEYYTVETNVDENKALNVIAPDAMKKSEGYLVGFTFKPFAKVPDQIFMGTKNTETNCYLHLGLTKDDNYINFTAPVPVVPEVDSPEGLAYENGVITGLDIDSTYEYAQFNINGIADDSWTAVTGATSFATDLCGLVAVRYAANGVLAASQPAYVYIPGKNIASIIHTTPTLNYEGTATIDVVDVVNAGKFGDARGRVVFNEGRWTGIALSNTLATRYNYDRFILGTTGVIPATIADALKDAADNTAIANARADAAEASEDIYFSYAYNPDEIIPMSDFISLEFRVSYRQGGFKVNGGVQTKITFKIVDKNGALVDRTIYKPADYSFNGTRHKVTLSDFSATDGYIVGIVINPFVLTDGSYFEYKNSYYGDYDVVLAEDCYKVDVILPAEKPIISISETDAVVTVENYNKNLIYGYSCDGGNSWTPFEGSSFTPERAGTEYTVKAFGSSSYFESEPSEAVTSPAVILSGISLVLDGTLGIKVYMDIHPDSVSDAYFRAMRTDSDFDPDTDSGLYETEQKCTTSTNGGWLSAITQDSNSGLYYTVLSLPAKDVDNVSFRCEAGVGSTALGTMNGKRISLPDYISSSKALAVAGEAEFIKASYVIEALERYTSYADNYFGKGDMTAYIADNISTIAPSRSGTLEGAAFYGTSLILEDSITVRHYFKITDREYFNKYTCDIPYGEKNGFIYYDMTDVPAQDMGKQQTLTINSADGKAFEINYSVENYIATALTDGDARLVSLMNAMYTYGKEAYSYAYPKPLYVKYDPTIRKESAVGGLHLYVPTKEGYIDYTLVHSVREQQNADIWRLSVVYLCDDTLNSLYPISVENAEWDMALKMNGRPDFVGGYAHGDEIMTDVKFYVDGVETDITTLTAATEITKLNVVENSIGYDPLDGITQALKHRKYYTVTHAGVRIDHRVEWLGDYDMGYSYLAMLPPPKTYTDMYYTNITPATNIIQGASNKVDGATSVTVYGSESGLYYTMTVNYYNTFHEPHMFITDNAGGSYNKTYFAYVKSGSVKKGDVWETFTHYRIEKK